MIKQRKKNRNWKISEGFSADFLAWKPLCLFHVKASTFTKEFPSRRNIAKLRGMFPFSVLISKKDTFVFELCFSVSRWWRQRITSRSLFNMANWRFHFFYFGYTYVCMCIYSCRHIYFFSKRTPSIKTVIGLKN